MSISTIAWHPDASKSTESGKTILEELMLSIWNAIFAKVVIASAVMYQYFHLGRLPSSQDLQRSKNVRRWTYEDLYFLTGSQKMSRKEVQGFSLSIYRML
jgi:hypothetical protein